MRSCIKRGRNCEAAEFVDAAAVLMETLALESRR